METFGVVDINRILKESLLGEVAREALGRMPRETTSEQLAHAHNERALVQAACKMIAEIAEESGRCFEIDLILERRKGGVLWAASGDLTPAVMYAFNDHVQKDIEREGGRETFIQNLLNSWKGDKDDGPPFGTYL